MREKIEKLLNEYSPTIYDDNDARRAIEFVRDLLEDYAEHIEKAEPYATSTIRDVKDSAYRVYDLLDVIDDFEKE